MAVMRGKIPGVNPTNISREELVRSIESYSKRNEGLIGLITKLRQENADLRSSLNSMNQRFFFKRAILIEKSTQTEIELPTSGSINIPYKYSTPHKKNNNKENTTPVMESEDNISPQYSISRKSMKSSTPPMPLSPAVKRVQKKLTEGCINIPNTPRKLPRNTKQPISYKEPSLHVKVRKGFEFFKFND